MITLNIMIDERCKTLSSIYYNLQKLNMKLKFAIYTFFISGLAKKLKNICLRTT